MENLDKFQAIPFTETPCTILMKERERERDKKKINGYFPALSNIILSEKFPMKMSYYPTSFIPFVIKLD